MKLAGTLGLIGLLSAVSVQADGGYAQSCDSWHMGDGNGNYHAHCEGNDYVINLNQCLANYNGNLAGANYGEFGNSCNDYSYDPSPGTLFFASCTNDNGVYSQSSVDLNGIIGFNNPNGLSCFGKYADYCLADGDCRSGGNGGY